MSYYTQLTENLITVTNEVDMGQLFTEPANATIIGYEISESYDASGVDIPFDFYYNENFQEIYTYNYTIGDYSKNPIFVNGVWNNNLFIKDIQSMDPGTLSNLISNGMIPLADFDSDDTYSSTLNKIFMIHSMFYQDQIQSWTDVILPGYSDLFFDAMTPMEIDYLSRQYYQIEKMQYLDELGIILHGNDGEYGMAEFVEMFESSLLKDIFSGSFEASTYLFATTIMTDKIIFDNIDSYKNLRFSSHQAHVSPHNTELIMGYRPLINPPYMENFYDQDSILNNLMIVSGSVIMPPTYTFSETFDEIIFTHTYFGTTSAREIKPSMFNREMSKWYDQFSEAYNNLGLVSTKVLKTDDAFRDAFTGVANLLPSNNMRERLHPENIPFFIRYSFETLIDINYYSPGSKWTSKLLMDLLYQLEFDP